MSSVKARGFSLIEVLIGCVLLMLIMTLIIQVVIPMGRGTVRGSQQMELQQVANNAVTRLAEDLQTAPPAGITRYPPTGNPGPGQPLLLAIQPLTGVDSVGQQTWSDSIILYWWYQRDGKLYRLTWPPGYPLGRRPDIDEPFKPTDEELLKLTENPRGQERLLGVIAELDVDLTVVPHVIRATLQAPSAPDSAPPESFSLTRRVYVRNERY